MVIFSCLSELPPNSKYILLTDSLSSLHLINDPFNPNPIIKRIYHVLSTLNSLRSTVTFIWVPCHIGFLEHDAVDLAAKETSSQTSITDKLNLPHAQYRNYYRSHITKLWKSYWKTQQSNKVLTIKTEPNPWSSSRRESKRGGVIIARLRIGHTRITHSYLVNPNILFLPSSPHCQLII